MPLLLLQNCSFSSFFSLYAVENLYSYQKVGVSRLRKTSFQRNRIESGRAQQYPFLFPFTLLFLYQFASFYFCLGLEPLLFLLIQETAIFVIIIAWKKEKGASVIVKLCEIKETTLEES